MIGRSLPRPAGGFPRSARGLVQLGGCALAEPEANQNQENRNLVGCLLPFCSCNRPADVTGRRRAALVHDGAPAGLWPCDMSCPKQLQRRKAFDIRFRYHLHVFPIYSSLSHTLIFHYILISSTIFPVSVFSSPYPLFPSKISPIVTQNPCQKTPTFHSTSTSQYPGVSSSLPNDPSSSCYSHPYQSPSPSPDPAPSHSGALSHSPPKCSTNHPHPPSRSPSFP